MSCETSCETVTGSVVALLDGELAEAERREVEVHLASCTACAQELSEIEATRRIVARHLAAAGAAVGSQRFDDLWQRVAADGSDTVRTSRAGSGSTRRASVSRSTNGRRRWLWAGASGGLALAAGLALLLLAPRPSGVTIDRRDARSGKAPAVAPAPAPKSVAAAKRVQRPATRVAKGGSDDAGADQQVARRADGKAAPEATTPAEEQPAEAVAVNELDPPRELLERPDMFLNYPIVRKLEELRHLDAVLADHGAEDQPDDGGAG